MVKGDKEMNSEAVARVEYSEASDGWEVCLGHNTPYGNFTQSSRSDIQVFESRAAAIENAMHRLRQWEIHGGDEPTYIRMEDLR